MENPEDINEEGQPEGETNAPEETSGPQGETDATPKKSEHSKPEHHPATPPVKSEHHSSTPPVKPEPGTPSKTPDTLATEPTAATREPDTHLSDTQLPDTHLSDTHLNEEAGEKRGGLLSGILIRAVFLALCVLAFTGQADRLANTAMRPVWEYDEAFLEKSLTHAVSWTLVLAVPKNIMATIETVQLEPEFVSTKVGSVNIGKMLDGYEDIIDDLFDFMALSTVLILIQIAMLNFIKYVSLKLFLGVGAGLCVIQFQRSTLFGKLGATLITLAIMSYVVYPLTLKMAMGPYEAVHVERSVRFSEDIGVLSEEFKDWWENINPLTNFGTDYPKRLLKAIKIDLGLRVHALKAALRQFWGLFIGYIFMFILTPLVTLGVCYLLMRQVLVYLDFPDVARDAQTGMRWATLRLGRKSRARFLRK